mmetsp:Transcript_4242/g.14743  ORF Transcript_4242/g.14743 Transcript_4242/m.14743 type:complete len:235 (-) Transcript_4242:85-789(-)
MRTACGTPHTQIQAHARGRAARTRGAATCSSPPPRASDESPVPTVLKTFFAASGLCVALSGGWIASTPLPAHAAEERCDPAIFKKGATTRAGFSDFATEQNPELYVDVRECVFDGLDLSKEVLSGIKAKGASFVKVKAYGAQSSRADFRLANLQDADFRATNLYGTNFNGANLENADFSGALASGARFGKEAETGKWANLKGINFEETLFSSSDSKEICKNPTLEFEAQAILGC